ncbi:MAG: alpha-amylase [Promethearchaeota archaeon]|nr:MAG: alpha-amylase [Candidatus Lokiarchaeota archaeon]
MKVSKEARKKYKLDGFKFSDTGNVIFNGKLYDVRRFVQKLNKKRDLINYPERAVKIGNFNGMALISEVSDYLIDFYDDQNEDIKLHEELYEYLKEKLGQKKLDETIKSLVTIFPPKPVYENKIAIDDYLENTTDNVKNKAYLTEEFIKLWISNSNPSFSEYLELFDDDLLEKRPVYKEIIDTIQIFFKEVAPPLEKSGDSLEKTLQAPFKKHPQSIKKQLIYIHEKYGDFLGKYSMMILTALDLIREEEMMRGLGPGEAQVLEYKELEYENFTPDKEWMPKVVMLAKHTYVWLDQLSKRYNRSITKLNEIPNEELNKLKEWGFNALWLIGLWERSQASKTIKRWCGNPEAEASAYSIYDYIIAHDLGGYEAYKDLEMRAKERGIRLASDMVPNHTGIVSKWTIEHPDWYIQLDHKPFPSYKYTGQSLSGDPNIGIYLEDKYFSREDAAVTFKRVDYRYNDNRYIYHGNDGTSFPWNDTAQLNYLNPKVREAVIQKILDVSKMFPIIRFDAAMTLTRKHFQRLWFPEPGTGGAIPSRAGHGMSKEEFFKKMPKEFWREVVDRMNEENPDTLLIAEAFWLLEGFFVRTLGMHRVYNSAFMNMLSDEDNSKYRAVIKNTLKFDPKILKRFVNFMNNPDEETAIKQFGDGDKYFGVCAMLVTMPGLPMFGHGQIQGFHEKYGMEYRKAYWDEDINWELLHHHERTIFPIMKKRYLFADVNNFLLYDFWTGNVVNEDVFAYSNRINNERALVIYHNKFAETKGYIKNSVGYAVKNGEEKKIMQTTLAEGLKLPEEGYCIFKDYMSGLEYIRRNKDIHERGLYLELNAYKTFVFMDFRIVQDNEFFHYKQLYEFLGGNGVYNIEETLQNVVYKPLHTPFEQLVNVQQFNKLIQKKEKTALMDRIYHNLKDLLQEVKNYSSGDNEIKPIKEEIIHKLRTVLNIENKITDLHLEPSIKKYIDEILPESKYEKSILYSWVFIHLLGKIVSEEDYELISRSWIDEFYLSKYINWTLEGMQSDKKQEINPDNATNLIKILTSQQNLFDRSNLKEVEEKSLLQQIFNNLEIQKYLGVNRYQDVLWFNAESFNRYIKWVLLINIINRISLSNDTMSQDIRKMTKIVKRWIELAEESDYKVNSFIDSMK